LNPIDDVSSLQSKASESGLSHEPDWPADAVEVGSIVDAWGVKGWMKVQSHAPDPQALFAARLWFLKAPDQRVSAPKPGGVAARLPVALRITQVREHGDGIVASAEGVADRSAAENLRGARIFASRADFPKPKADEYYWVDLIGLKVINQQGEDLGQVIGLIDTGPHSVLRVVPADKVAPVKPDEERLIPFVSAYVGEVSLTERRITVDWGLDY
jgi:16S rRNA processing protein RimM